MSTLCNFNYPTVQAKHFYVLHYLWLKLPSLFTYKLNCLLFVMVLKSYFVFWNHFYSFNVWFIVLWRQSLMLHVTHFELRLWIKCDIFRNFLSLKWMTVYGSFTFTLHEFGKLQSNATSLDLHRRAITATVDVLKLWLLPIQQTTNIVSSILQCLEFLWRKLVLHQGADSNPESVIAAQKHIH